MVPPAACPTPADTKMPKSTLTMVDAIVKVRKMIMLECFVSLLMFPLPL